MARFDDLPPKILRTIITTAFEDHKNLHGCRYDYRSAEATTFYLFPLATMNRVCCGLGFEAVYAWILEDLRRRVAYTDGGLADHRGALRLTLKKSVNSWIATKEEQQRKWEKMTLFVQRNGMQAAEKIWSDF